MIEDILFILKLAAFTVSFAAAVFGLGGGFGILTDHPRAWKLGVVFVAIGIVGAVLTYLLSDVVD